jgi:septum site-determining protein MinC
MMEAFPDGNGSMAESAVAAFTKSRAAFDLKGVMTSLTVIRLKSRDLNLIERQLRAKVMQHPQFFQQSPVVLDVSEIEGGVAGFPLAALVRALHVCRVVPVAVTNIDDANRPMAMAAGLGVVQLSASRPAGDPEASEGRTPAAAGGGRLREAHDEPAPRPLSDSRDTVRVDRREIHARAERAERDRQREHQREITPTPAPAKAAPPPPPSPSQAAAAGPASHRAPMVVRQAVRSGQLIYAERNDLIVLAPVNPGAQLIADGNIHIYGTLRGRAVAGAKGYTDARIFCQKLEAELVAISGAYVTSEDLPAERRGKPAQIYLQDGKCVVTGL